MSITSENSPIPRLCIVKKTYPEQEYGFNLHGEKGKKAQYIGSVDPGSPADLASLRPGDKIIEVNGNSILHDDHKHVVAKIREDPMQCKLLVVEDETTASLFKVIPKTAEKPVEQTNIMLNQSKPQLLTDSTGKQYKPRLCQLNKTMAKDEYGFNLHAESSKGYFIGKVDQNSIAEIAGLVEGQRIVGVNRTLIYPSSVHGEVVTLIKQNPTSVLLLVASAEVDEYYHNKCIEFNFNDAEVVQTRHELNVHPTSNGAIAETNDEDVRRRQIVGAVQNLTLTSDNLTNGIHFTTDLDRLTNGANGRTNGKMNHYQVGEESNDAQNTKRINKSTSPVENPVDRRKNVRDLSSRQSNSNNVDRREDERSGSSSTSTSTDADDDLFKMSAAQMRERVTKKKKSDARHENNLSLMEKYEIIKNL